MKSCQLSIFCLLFSVAIHSAPSCCCIAQVKESERVDCLPHTDAANQGQWQLQEAFSDEFNDGDVKEIWHLQGRDDGRGQYYNGNKGRNSQYIPDSVSESNGILKIKSNWDENFDFAKGYGTPPVTTGALVSKEFLRYGYLEIRCRVGRSPMSAAFWAVGTDNRGELDVFEHVGQGWDTKKDNLDISQTMQMSIHNWSRAINENHCNRRHWTQKHTLGFDVTEGMHVYAADWTENYVKFYVDGKLVRVLTKEEAVQAKLNGLSGWVIDHGQRIWLDCELFDWEGRISELTPEMFGEEAVFEVDYVRVWKRGPDGKHDLRGHGANLIANGNFATNLKEWETKGAVKMQDVSAWKFWKDNNPSLDKHAMQIGAGGTGAATQTIEVEPNCRYLLTAYLRTPATTGTLEPANLRVEPLIFHEGWMGVEHGGSRITRKLFHNWFQSYSIEFVTGEEDTKATIFFNNTETNRGGLLHVDGVSVVKLKDLR